MLVLFETAAGYAVFKINDEKPIQEIPDLSKAFESTELLNKTIQLEKFVRFEDTREALAASADVVEGKISGKLKKLLKKLYIKELRDDVLAVADKKLSQDISTKMNVSTISDSNVQKLMRAIRAHINTLIPDVNESDMTRMQLGLAHSLDRYKLKCNPDKIDTMIVQAVGLLDELDKESNNYVMRCKEMYGWHFPELSKIVTDNMTYVKLIRRIGVRENISMIDVSDIIAEDLLSQAKDAAIVSLGTEITDDDLVMIHTLCDQIIDISDSRDSLNEYLIKRMIAVAPNLTSLVGEVLGARLIARAGTLINLAKYPASTVQILGAEKALFRALKTKHNTPKYGLMYHASLVASAGTDVKGKVSRMLAAKTAIAARLDALGEEDVDTEHGMKSRAYLESRIRQLEASGPRPRISHGGKRPFNGTPGGNSAKKFRN